MLTAMKTPYPRLILAAALALGAISVYAANPVAKPANVTVTFHEPDKFTDARASFGGPTEDYYLDILKKTIQERAALNIAPGQKLEVTITDVDLAGDFLPGRAAGSEDIRIIKEIYRPRITLNFKLLGADGKVVKEGDRMLSDMNFMNNISIIGRNDPLFYDKALLKDWVEKEFRS